MRYEIINEEAFYIIGKAVRTTNQNGQAEKDIGALWQQFLGEHLMEQIPDKENDDIYCVYTDYETDANGPYTTILGCKVTSLDHIPAGMTGKTIAASKYQLYQSTGKLPDYVLATWVHIWQSPTDRKYSADFDIYDSRSQNPDHAEVITYLSVH